MTKTVGTRLLALDLAARNANPDFSGHAVYAALDEKNTAETICAT
jgi:hypothetical protein